MLVVLLTETKLQLRNVNYFCSTRFHFVIILESSGPLHHCAPLHYFAFRGVICNFFNFAIRRIHNNCFQSGALIHDVQSHLRLFIVFYNGNCRSGMLILETAMSLLCVFGILGI